MQNMCVFLSKVSDRPISPQSGEGDMHEVPRLRTKVVRGFRERVGQRAKARIRKTARTPTDKSVWGIKPVDNCKQAPFNHLQP